MDLKFKEINKLMFAEYKRTYATIYAKFEPS